MSDEHKQSDPALSSTETINAAEKISKKFTESAFNSPEFENMTVKQVKEISLMINTISWEVLQNIVR